VPPVRVDEWIPRRSLVHPASRLLPILRSQLITPWAARRTLGISSRVAPVQDQVNNADD